jgi:hypothetical protein
MATNNNKQRGIVPDPAETSRDGQQHQQKTREGDFRNAETAADNASYFDDDYEIKKEGEISREEAKGENREDTGKS